MESTLKNTLPQVILYFQVHQPRRLARKPLHDIGGETNLFDDNLNQSIITRVAQNCYLPTNELLRRLIDKYPKLKVCFSLSGMVMDQLAEYQPEVLSSFRDLAQSGSVEFLGETYYHSLSSVTPNNEFIKQVEDHRTLLQNYLGYRPSVFRNTGLIYSTSIGSKVAQLGFKGILCDGAGSILAGRSPYHIYKHPTQSNFNILFRNSELSDDITFGYGLDGGLDLNQYLQKIYSAPGGSVILIGIDYETLGEHYSDASGISVFLEKLISALHNDWEVKFSTPSEAINENTWTETFDPRDFISWAGAKDLSSWLGNEMQCDAFKTLNALEEKVMTTQDPDIIKTWRNLQASDHFYYMSTNQSNEENAPPRFSHYGSPYEAFINYMNVLSDFSLRLDGAQTTKENNTTESQRRHEDVPIWAQQYAANVANTIG
jgi:alpha-amylase